jgi:hypothetical protein
MKHIIPFLTTIAAIFGIIPCLSFHTQHFFANKVFVEPVAGGFLYFNDAPTGFSCQSGGICCTLSTTATAAYFNANCFISVPANTISPTQHPQVTRLDVGSSYKPL